jgi:hypothetical protein
MMKKLSYLLLLIITSTTYVYAQSGQNEEVDYVVEQDDYVLSFDSLKTKDKLHYSFSMGAGFANSGSYGNYFSTYYRPTISYDLSPKFSINAGITYVNSSVNNLPVSSDYSYQLFSGNISQYYAFVGGQYKLTEKLSVGGSIFYDITSYNAFDGTKLNKNSGLDNLGYSANFRYKVRKGFYIEGEIRMNDKNPYHQYSNHFSNGFTGGTFENSFFGR